MVRPSGEVDLTPEEAMTAANLWRIAPDPDDVRLVGEWFAEQGLETTPFVGIGITLLGDRADFERIFGTTVATNDRGGASCTDEQGQATEALPLDSLPWRVASRIVAVSFDGPAETTNNDETEVTL